MKSEPNPDPDRLDGLLNEVLGDLPEQEAPGSLLPNVMARIAREQKKEQSSRFAAIRWGLILVSVGCMLLATYFSPSIFAYLSRYAATLQLGGAIENVNAGIQIIATVGDALGKVFGLISFTDMLPIATVIIVSSTGFLAGIATLIFRLTFSTSGRPTANLVFYE